MRKNVMFLFVAIAGFLIITSLWGFYSSIRPPRFVSTITPQDLGMAYEDVSFSTDDGVALKGWFIPAEKSDAKTIVLLHGYPADKGDILPALAFLHDEYNLFLFDFRYFGQSEGAYSTAGAKEVRDLQGALRYLRGRGITEVGVWGFSMGGAVALMAAPHASEIRAVITESSYATLAGMSVELFRIPGLRHVLGYLVDLWARLFIGIDPFAISPAVSARTLSIPVLIIHAKNDEVIPFTNALLLQEALQHNPAAEFWFEEGLGHGQLGSDYEQRVKGFFDAHL